MAKRFRGYIYGVVSRRRGAKYTESIERRSYGNSWTSEVKLPNHTIWYSKPPRKKNRGFRLLQLSIFLQLIKVCIQYHVSLSPIFKLLCLPLIFEKNSSFFLHTRVCVCQPSRYSSLLCPNKNSLTRTQTSCRTLFYPGLFSNSSSSRTIIVSDFKFNVNIIRHHLVD